MLPRSRFLSLIFALAAPISASAQPPVQHWAFQPVRQVEPPIDPSGWAAHPVDRFIAAKQREHGVTPAGTADKRALLRRVTFDLIGLPPTPTEIDAFLKDDSPRAFERVVDRLLASSHYGERWGRHWMDLVRYADTAGDNADYPIPEARLYRDWIIDAFNADKPYDEFVREQLAGDILAKLGPREQYAGRVIATTYLGLSRRYLTAPYEGWHLTLEDSIDTTGRVFMGLTLRCARCHDHKFDPVTKQDYYALYGIFASTQYPYAGSEEFASKKFPRSDFVPLAPASEVKDKFAAYERRMKELKETIAAGEKEVSAIDGRIAERTKQFPETPWYRGIVVTAEIAKLKKQRGEVNGKVQSRLAPSRQELLALERFGSPPAVPVAYAVHEGKAADAPIQVTGEPEKTGPVVPRDVPKFLSHGRSLKIAPGGSGRLEFAQWLTRPDHPLTARVMVNRIWQHHFGRGLVPTPSNFGRRGEPPTHPELLDYLAARFVESGWSIKAIHRLILSTKTYQLSANAECGIRNAELRTSSTPHSAFRTPHSEDSRWYTRADRRRLDAESIRDSLLFVGGKLDPSRPGAHPFPPITAWGWTQHNPFKDVYPSSHRSVYLMTQRLQRHPFLAIFDGPDTNTTTDARGSSTVPPQALFMMNNPFVAAQARGFAGRLLAVKEPAARLRLAYELAFGRLLETEEERADLEYVEHYRTAAARGGAPDAEAQAWMSLAKVLLCANEFVYVD